MATLDDLKSLISTYERDIRREGLEPFEPGKQFDLFPKSPGPLAWPNTWPYSEHPGVYAMLDEHAIVLYVGKASFKNCLGSRLGDYFCYESGRGSPCKLKHTWHTMPRFVYLVPVSLDRSYEASALEEYLILKIQPPENRIGCVSTQR